MFAGLRILSIVAVSTWVWTAPLSAIAATHRTTGTLVGESTQEMHDRAADAVLQGRLIEALHGFTTVLKLDPTNASAYYNRGNVRYLRHEFELALEDFGSALKYRPDFAAAYMNRGVTFSNLDRLDEALSDLDRAADLDPSNPDVFFNRAIVHVKRGAMDNALRDYDRIVQLDGSNVDIAAARSRLKALLTRIDEMAVVGRERSRRIIAEIDHARSVEAVMAFAEQTCIQRGDDHKALSSLAQADGWTSVTNEQLALGSTPKIELTAGWTLTNRLGSIAVVQSRSIRDPHLVSCSITAKLGDPHWFEDFATLFTSKFDGPRLIIKELEDRRLSRQVVVRGDRSRVDVTLQQTTDSKVLTIGTIHDTDPQTAIRGEQ